MRALQQAGKIRTFGISVSDHRPDEANGVIVAGRVNIIEAPYNLLDQRAATQLFPLAKKYGISIIARTPLASGALTGTWHQGMKFHRQDWRKRVFRGELLQETLQRVSRFQSLVDSSISMTHLALRFCLSHPAVTTVIPGVRRVEQVQCNLAVLESKPLSPHLLAHLTNVWQREMSQHVRTSIGEEGES
jgi:aryl-alcohol dehydrogenase-like predicted oxidoreductase